MEPALFFLPDGQSRLVGILVTHVDDVEGGVQQDYVDRAFAKYSLALEYATNHFNLRGREIKQHDRGHVDVSMRNYSLNTKKIQIDRIRRQQLESSLTEEEFRCINLAQASLVG